MVSDVGGGIFHFSAQGKFLERRPRYELFKAHPRFSELMKRAKGRDILVGSVKDYGSVTLLMNGHLLNRTKYFDILKCEIQTEVKFIHDQLLIALGKAEGEKYLISEVIPASTFLDYLSQNFPRR